MPLKYLSVGDLAAVVGEPLDFLPVFFLIFQEHVLILHVLSDFDFDVAGVVGLAPDVKRLHCVRDVVDRIPLHFCIFRRQFCLLIVLFLWQ